MTGNLQITAPATLTVMPGSASLSSYNLLPPGGIFVSDPNNPGTLTVQITAGNAGAVLQAPASGGASVVGGLQTLTISGTAAQVNAALAGFTLREPYGVASDVLILAASDPLALGATSGVQVVVGSDVGPAFVAPPQIVTLQADTLANFSTFFTLSDPVASALAATGFGAEEILSMTLSVPDGVLALSGFDPTAPISVTGQGTGRLVLQLTANDISLLNNLLASLVFSGPAEGEHLSYALWNLSGPLPLQMTAGKVFLSVRPGSLAAGTTLVAGSQAIVIGSQDLGGGTEALTGTLGVRGNVGDGSVWIGPSGNLQAELVSLSGTSLEFGTIGAGLLDLGGTLLAGSRTTIEGQLTLEPFASLDFTGVLVAGDAETLAYQNDIWLQGHAVLSGDGTLVLGNFSEPGALRGAGTLLVPGGETLQLVGGAVGGGVDLAVAGGGVLVLGPTEPLYGIFETAALTVVSNTTLGFLSGAGVVPVTGGYASTLGGAGGAIVITGPEIFAGTITGFTVGDELIFPSLANLTILNANKNSFTVAGQDASGSTVSYIINAAVPSDAVLTQGMDAAGDPSVMLRAASGAVVSSGMALAATQGVAQALPGLILELAGATTQSLTLTVAVGAGTLSTAGTSGAAITLTSANVAQMNAWLGALSYTGAGSLDTISFSSSSGVLAGVKGAYAITMVNAGTVASGQGAYSAAQTVLIPPGGGLQSFGAAAAGAVLDAGMVAFSSLLWLGGISGTALLVDQGGQAIFGGGADATLGGGVTLGDAAGAGTMAVLSDQVTASGNLLLAGVTAASGSELDILAGGSLALGGTLQAGSGGRVLLAGSLNETGLALGAGSSLFAFGDAGALLGTVDDAGMLVLTDTAQAVASGISVSGVLELGGHAGLDIGGLLAVTAGFVTIGADADLAAGSLTLAGGGLLDAGTLLASGAIVATPAITLAGGTLAAPTISVSSTLDGSGVATGTLLSVRTLIAEGGTLIVGAQTLSQLVTTIGADSVLEIAGSLTGTGWINFNGDGELILLNPLIQGTHIHRFVAGDAIDIKGFAPAQVTYASQTIGLFDTLGHLEQALTLVPNGGQPAVTILSDGAGGSLITLGGELPCFARGTRLLTPHGYKPVELLKPGDPLITLSGERRPVRWIGWRTIDLGPEPARVALPVTIAPGAFGPGVPGRALKLSPVHGIHVDGILIPAAHLVNGATILRERGVRAMTYFHVELDRHDILLAEGLACESYLDTGNREGLYRELGVRTPAARAFAPTVTSGPELARVRRRLHGIAEAAGYSLTYWPVLRALAAGEDVKPQITREGAMRRALLRFSRPVRDITLLSQACAPAETDPDSEDWRELSLCLRPGAKMRLLEGWYRRARRDHGRWMGRVAALRLPAARAEVTLELAAIVQSWVKDQKFR